jgi:DNA-binding transcriptional ArsR family regulator
MRLLFHPSIEDVTVEGILHALSDPVRARIYLSLAETGSSQICSNFLTISEKTIPKSTLSQHFKILREAGLIRSERQGVEVYNTSRCKEIEAKFPGLLMAVRQAYALQCDSGKQGEGSPDAKISKKYATDSPANADK